MTAADHRAARSALARGWAYLRRPGAARVLAELRETQWLAPAALAERQLAALQALAPAAGLERPRTLEDIRRWPISTPETLAAPSPRLSGRVVSSSGTGGCPRAVLLSAEAVRWQEAVEERAREWAGGGGGRARIWACCIEPTWSQRVALSARNTKMLYAPALSESPELRRRWARRIAERPPELLQGVSNVLGALARELAPLLPARPPIVVLSAGNHLTPWYRRALESASTGWVRRRYAAVETGLIAAECEAGVMHVNSESLLVEAVGRDGEPLPAGTPGDLLVTSLHNLSSPLLRYRLGDVGAVSPSGCSCGRLLPELTLLGRRREIFSDPTGAPIAPARIFAALDGDGTRLTDASVVRSGDGVRVEVVPEHGGPDSRIASDLATVLGLPEARVEVVGVERIPTGASGKTLLLDAEGS